MNWHFDFLLAALAASGWLFFTGIFSIPAVIFLATKGRVRLKPMEAVSASALFFIGRVIVQYFSMLALVDI